MAEVFAVRPNAPLAEQEAFLDYLPASMTFEEWAGELRMSYNRSNLEQWRVAVLLTDGENRWPEWLQIAEDLGISEHRISQSRYIVNAARNLPSTVNLLALPFWHWDTIAHVKQEDREAFALRMIELQPTQKEIRALYAEYKALKQIAPAEQPKFENGLADKPADDGLPLAPHGVCRIEEVVPTDKRPLPVSIVTVPDPQQGDRGSGTPMIDDLSHAEVCQIARDETEEFGAYRVLLGLSDECLDQIDLLRRYYKQPDMTAAQVIERAIGQLSTILKKRLERFE